MNTARSSTRSQLAPTSECDQAVTSDLADRVLRSAITTSPSNIRDADMLTTAVLSHPPELPSTMFMLHGSTLNVAGISGCTSMLSYCYDISPSGRRVDWLRQRILGDGAWHVTYLSDSSSCCAGSSHGYWDGTAFVKRQGVESLGWPTRNAALELPRAG